MFKTRLDHYHGIDLPSPAGEDVVDEYGVTVNEEGLQVLSVVGKKNIYLPIQEAAVGASVYDVLERYENTGDVSLLEKQKGLYADVTKSPRTLAELEQFRIDSRNAFYSLPADVRRMFGDNYHVFMADPQQAQAILDSLDPSRVRAAQKAREEADRKAAAAQAAEGGAAAAASSQGVTISRTGVEEK